jgi:hypothetical protein
MLEEVRDTLAIMSSPTSLGKRRRNIDRFQLGTEPLLLSMRHRIGHDNLAQFTVVDDLNGLAREDTMRNNRNDFFGVVLFECLGGFGKRAAGIGHVVNENGNLVGYVTDKNHAGDFVRTGSLFVDKGKV